MAAVLEDVSGAQNVEKHLDNHKGPKNLWVISPFFFFSETELETLGLRVRTF